MSGYLKTAAVAIIAIAIVYRVSALRTAVLGA